MSTNVTICIHYAYPSSPMAKRLRRALIGAWYYTVAHPDCHYLATPRGVTGSYAETDRLCGPNFYSLPRDQYSQRAPMPSKSFNPPASA